ncbi:hypothetical protein EVJ58_g1303 [Rhodofomes roseus]|uniref:Uncharacterized protein n=1 Tax=Rhodofomes roseus TaxID=34475 RepID=A0A4Y9YZF1_9APHY|nr:hypothetical protein EVJ58_g1303 [Rhodofomes roseus]
MPARHALSIPEILLHVSEQLQPDTEFWEERERGHPESRAAALACPARVCEGFREPALRGLWRDIPSIEVLVKLVRPSAEGPLSGMQLVNKLAGVPYLTSVSVYMEEDLITSEERPTFSDLKSLDIVEWLYGGPSVSFLTSAAFPRLQSLSLYTPGTHISDALWQTSPVTVAGSLPQLRELCMESTGSSSKSDPSSPQPMNCSVADVLRPLLSLANMRKIEIEFGLCVLDTSDDDVREITRSWPKLQVLKLSHHPSSIRPSLHALMYVAQNCPDLTELALSPLCHDGEIPASDAVAVAGHGLRRVHSDGWATRLPPKEIKSFIYALFPDVKFMVKRRLKAAKKST